MTESKPRKSNATKKQIKKEAQIAQDNDTKKRNTIIIIALAGIALLLVCLIVFLATGTLLVALPGSGGEVRIKDNNERVLSQTGGEVSLGELTVDVPSGVVLDEALLQIGEVSTRSLPLKLPKNVDLVGNVYALEWGQGALISGDPVEVTFSYNPRTLPKNASEEELAIMTYDGSEWLRIPAEVDTDSNTVTAQVNHFCLKALVRYTLTGFSQRDVADRTRADIDVSGRVEYTLADYAEDRSAKTAPAGNLRFALIDTDGIVLYDGRLENDGSFAFVIPEGTDVAIDLDATMRIYAEDNQAGRVLDRTPPNGGVWWYDSEVQSVSLSSDRMDFFTITIPAEDSGAFNILHAVKQGQAASPGLKPDPVNIVWAGTGRGTDVDTHYDEDLDVIFLSKSPQSAWDEDLILRMYGEYVHHWLLLDNSSLFCGGSPKGPEKKSNECQAWNEGFGYFYSAMVRGDEYYEVYENSDGVEEEFNLENGAVAYGPRSSGTVSQVLWDMIDSRNDGENVEVSVSDIFDLIFEYNTSIDNIGAFYDFWTVDHNLNWDLCQLFADYEIVDMDDCDELKYLPEMEQEEESIVVTDMDIKYLEYGDGSMGSLQTYDEQFWSFEAEEGDVVTITIQPLDEGLELDLVLIDEYDDFIAFGEGSISRLSIEQFTIPADGEYLINVAALAGEGDYTISLDKMLYDKPQPATKTFTATPKQATATPTLTRTGTQVPTKTATTTQTPTLTSKPSQTPTTTLQGGPTGGTIRFTIIGYPYRVSISTIAIGMPVTNWDDVSNATLTNGTTIFDQYNDPLKPGEQITIDAPAGVWSITAWSRAISGESLFDAEMLIDMREDTEWVIEDHPKWD